jgi:hypothetical protein
MALSERTRSLLGALFAISPIVLPFLLFDSIRRSLKKTR